MRRYELMSRLAVGGMGEVFLAEERGLDGLSRQVVIKRLLPQVARKPEVVERFLDEARIGALLRHPNIVQLHDLGNERGTYFIAMEYVAGPTLAQLHARLRATDRTMPRSIALYIVAKLAEALAHAHAAKDGEGRILGLVHRDVTPQNVLLTLAG